MLSSLWLILLWVLRLGLRYLSLLLFSLRDWRVHVELLLDHLNYLHQLASPAGIPAHKSLAFIIVSLVN